MSERILDHFGVAVPSLDDAIPIWASLVGAAATGRETVAEQGVEVVFIGSGAGRVELLAPTGPASPIARFLEKRGPGIHHVCYRVPDIEAALATFRAEGFRLIDEVPRRGAHNHLVAFLHPQTSTGTLVELVEAASDK